MTDRKYDRRDTSGTGGVMIAENANAKISVRKVPLLGLFQALIGS